MLGPRKPLGGQYVGAGGALVTPEQVAQQKQIAAALLEQAGDTSPVGHWTAALNRGLQGWLGGRDMYRARQSESEGTSKALERFNARNSGAGAASRVAEALAGGAADGQPYTPPAEAAAIREGLIARGLPEHIADGFIMNFQDESGLNPGINERNPIVPGSRGGFGLYQLTGPRRRAYEAYAAENGVNPADVDAQLDWLMYELQGPEAKAAQSIFAAQNAGEAGAAIVNNFLRPAPEHRTSRANRYLGAGAGISSAPSPRNVSQIAELLADPWLPKDAKAVLQAEMNQQMQMQNAAYEMQLQQQDPMRQIQLQQERLKLDSMLNPGRETIEVGGVLLDKNTLEPVFDSRTDKGTPDIQNYEYYRANAEARGERAMPFEQFKATIARAGSGGNPLVGSIPAGMKAVTDPLTGDVIGLEPIPGGPAATEAQNLAEAAGRRDENAATATSIVTSAAQRAREALKSPMSGGLVGAATSYLPNSEAAEVYRQVDVLKSNATVENLNAMRAASPTGGALGSVTEKEGAMLAAKSGALDPKSPYFDRDLADYELTLLRTIHGNTEGSRLFDEMYPGGVAGITGTKRDTPTETEQPKPRRRYNPQTRSFE